MVNINWQKLALNLRKHKPLTTLSAEIGRHDGYLNQIARGELEEPKFSDGLKMLNLHLDVFGLEQHRELLKK
jgi:hypothetical protein